MADSYEGPVRIRGSDGVLLTTGAAALEIDPDLGNWRGVLQTLRGTAVAGKALVVQIEIPEGATAMAQLRAKGLHREQLFFGKGIRRKHQEVITLRGAHHGQRRTGASTGELHDTHAWREGAPRFSALDHSQRHAVFVGAGRIRGLELDEDLGNCLRVLLEESQGNPHFLFPEAAGDLEIEPGWQYGCDYTIRVRGIPAA